MIQALDQEIAALTTARDALARLGRRGGGRQPAPQSRPSKTRGGEATGTKALILDVLAGGEAMKTKAIAKAV